MLHCFQMLSAADASIYQPFREKTNQVSPRSRLTTTDTFRLLWIFCLIISLYLYPPEAECVGPHQCARTAQVDQINNKWVDTIRRGHNVGFSRDGSYVYMWERAKWLSVCHYTFSYKKFLLQIQWANFQRILQECSSCVRPYFKIIQRIALLSFHFCPSCFCLGYFSATTYLNSM